MCKPDKTYHCTVRNLNQTLVTEYDITVSREFNNVLDNNDIKQNDDINISDVEPIVNNKKDKVSLGVKIFFCFVFGINVLLFLVVLYILSVVFNISKIYKLPECDVFLCICILTLMIIILFITAVNLLKKDFSYKIPDLNTSYKSFFFYVIVLSLFFGIICFMFKKTYKLSLLINSICILFCLLSILWIAGNIYKAALSGEPKKYGEKINLVIQFNVSVLTLIGVFISKIESYSANDVITSLYALSLAIFLFAPFVIPYCINKLSVSLNMVIAS